MEKIEMLENNPFEVRVSVGNIGSYGSYNSGLPMYNVPELEQQYSYLREYARWAIENTVCYKCRFPWGSTYHTCECGKYEEFKRDIDLAEEAGLAILAYDELHTIQLAKKMEEDMKGDSEYAQLSRKARTVMRRRIERYSKDMLDSVPVRKSVIRSKFYSFAKWFRPSFLKWKFFTPEHEKSKSIPLYAATDEIVENMKYGNKRVPNGNCCIRTKGGSVVVVPSGMVDALKGQYKGAQLVAPRIKD